MPVKTQEIDLTEKIKARYSVMCDGCQKEIGSEYPNASDEDAPESIVRVEVKTKVKDNYGSYYDHEETKHFCGNTCAGSYFSKKN